MAVPVTPYSLPAQVAYLMQTLFFGGAPSPNTAPPESVVTTLISWTDAVVDATFRSIGYRIPFVVISGEAWPTTQTNFLSFMSAVGAAAMAGGYVLSPYPTRGNIGGTEETGYARLFERMRGDIMQTGLGFRAGYLLGSKAEKWISEPYGPRLDFLEDYRDPTRYSLLQEYTDMILDVYDEERAIDIEWDYMYSLRASSVA